MSSFLTNVSFPLATLLAIGAVSASARADDAVRATGDAATVPLHISGAANVALEMHRPGAPDNDGWSRVCDAPCDARVPLGPEYRVTGPGLQPSGDFELHDSGEPVNLDVKPVTAAHHETAKTLKISGALLLGGGVSIVGLYGVLGLVDAAKNVCGISGVPGCNPRSPSAAIAWTGVGVMTLGVAVVAAGLALSEGTTVNQGAPRPSPQEPAASPDRWAPTPSWGATAPGPSPLAQVPLLAGTF